MPSPLEDVKALFTGLATTMKFFVRRPETVEYPEVKRAIPVGARGRHQLRRHEDGLERCIGCELCAAACPAAAIRVVAAENDPEHPVSPGERYAAVYEIDLLRCIFCGFCEEACPTGAIQLTPRHDLVGFSRKDFLVDRDWLLVPDVRAAGGTEGSGPKGERA